ncbi:MAG: hypothetical protein IT377_33640 [Polyangiaceae bacterium]|nr:hypothetical protein [Polyangiaceae bacterium]
MARLVAWFSLLLLVACSSSASRIASPEATEVERDLLGGAPDARLVMRLDKAFEDPVYGGPPTRYDRRTPVDPELDAFLAGVKGIELWFVADDTKADASSLLIVVRGQPNFGYLQQHKDTRALFAREPERLPTGVRLYDFKQGGTHVAFFVLPSGSWVIATGRIVGRVRYHFFSHGGDPPAARQEPDALLAMWVGPGVMRLADFSKRGGGFEGLSVAVRSSARGDMEASATFIDDKHANEAQAALTELLAELPKAQKALADRCPAWQSVRFEMQRRGRTLTGRVANLPPLIQAYRTGACRRDDSPRALE